MFFSLVLSIVGLFNSASEDRKAIVEDYPFRLCYYVTAALLFFFTSLLGVKDAFRKYSIYPQIREQMSGPDLHVFTLKFLALKKWFFPHKKYFPEFF